MRPTAFGTAVDALVALLTPTLPTVDVIDGYAFSRENAAALIVGVSSSEEIGVPAATSAQAPLGGGTRDRVEELSINCSLSSGPVGDTIKATRDYCIEQLDLLDDAIRADESLGGAVSATRIGPAMAWYQFDTTSGDQVRVDFTVTVESFL